MLKYFSLISKTALDLRFYALEFLEGGEAQSLGKSLLYWGQAFGTLEVKVIVFAGRDRNSSNHNVGCMVSSIRERRLLFVLMQPICFTHRIDFYGNTATFKLLGGTAQESRG